MQENRDYYFFYPNMFFRSFFETEEVLPTNEGIYFESVKSIFNYVTEMARENSDVVYITPIAIDEFGLDRKREVSLNALAVNFDGANESVKTLGTVTKIYKNQANITG